MAEQFLQAEWNGVQGLSLSLPEEKRRSVLLYYFFNMSYVEIAKLYQIPRSTVQYRRTSSFDLLKHYLEEHVYDYLRSVEQETMNAVCCLGNHSRNQGRAAGLYQL